MVYGECAKSKVENKRTARRRMDGEIKRERSERATRRKRWKEKKRKKRNSYSRVIGLGQEGAELLDPVVDVEAPPSLD